MPDREKVIAALKCFLSNGSCTACEYADNDSCLDAVLADAMLLLKEPDTIRQCAYCKYYAGTHPEFAMCSELDICVDFDFYCKYWTKRI